MHVVVRRLASGERIAMLLDGQGVPLYTPTLFATVKLRNSCLAVNSIKNRLYELTVLLHWQRVNGRDLEAEFQAGNFLSFVDIESIRAFAAKKLREVMKPTRVANDRSARVPEASLAPVTNHATVSRQVHYNRLTTFADYVEFLGRSLIARRSDRNLTTAFDQSVKTLRDHRPCIGSNQDDDPDRMSLPTALVQEFIWVGSEGHPDNPFRNGTIQRRNELLFRILFATGIRLGELLSLRLDNIQTGHEPTITVRRTHDDIHDPRAYQPVAKTKERTLDISEDLAVKIHRYCMEDRASTPGANRHPYLFITHRRGKTCGQPLSTSSVSNKVFAAMQRIRPEFSGISPHSFRHHKNYLFSKEVDAHNRKARSEEDPAIEPISESRELRMRAQLNGHRSLKSGEAYNRRRVREDTQKAVLETQRRQWERSAKFRNDDDA